MRKITKKMIKEAMENIGTKKLEDVEAIGIRFDDKHYDIGDILPESHSFEERFGDMTCEEIQELPTLDGTSAYCIDDGRNWDREFKYPEIEVFESQQVSIIAGEYRGTGDDEGEIIIKNAEVLYIF